MDKSKQPPSTAENINGGEKPLKEKGTEGH